MRKLMRQHGMPAVLIAFLATLTLSGCRALYPRTSGTFGAFDTGNQPFDTQVNVPGAGGDITLDYAVRVDNGAFTLHVIDPQGEIAWEKTYQPGMDGQESHAIAVHTGGVWIVRVKMQDFTGWYSLGIQAPSAFDWATVAEVLIDVGAAFIVAWLVRRRWGGPWRAFWIGALFFGLCQLAELPLVIGINLLKQEVTLPLWLNGLVGGAIAGVFEETTRYLAMRFTGTMRRHRTWSASVLYGAGHGGLENVMVGVGIVVLTLLTLLPATYLPEPLRPLLATRPWYSHLYGGLSRVMALAMQIGLTLLVLQVFAQGKRHYLWIAILWHIWIDFTIIGLSSEIAWLSVTLMVLYTLVSLGIIVHYKRTVPHPISQNTMEAS